MQILNGTRLIYPMEQVARAINTVEIKFFSFNFLGNRAKLTDSLCGASFRRRYR